MDGGHAPRVVVDHAAHGQITLTFANPNTYADVDLICVKENHSQSEREAEAGAEAEAAYVDCSRTESTRASYADCSRKKIFSMALCVGAADPVSGGASAATASTHEHEHALPRIAGVYVHVGGNVTVGGMQAEIPYASALAGCHPSD